MKNDLVTSIAVAIFGVVAAYFVCNLLAGEAQPYSFYAVDESASEMSLDEIPVDVFNYKALNPTVEVYVGDCREYDEKGGCVDESAEQIEEGIIDEDATEDDEKTSNDNQEDE